MIFEYILFAMIALTAIVGGLYIYETIMMKRAIMAWAKARQEKKAKRRWRPKFRRRT